MIRIFSSAIWTTSRTRSNKSGLRSVSEFRAVKQMSLSPGVRDVIVTFAYVRVMKRPSDGGFVKMIRSDGAVNVVSSMMTDQNAVARTAFEQFVG